MTLAVGLNTKPKLKTPSLILEHSKVLAAPGPMVGKFGVYLSTGCVRIQPTQAVKPRVCPNMTPVFEHLFNAGRGGHGGRVVTLWPPISEAGVRFPARPQVGKLVVACRWSAVYSTEP